MKGPQKDDERDEVTSFQKIKERMVTTPIPMIFFGIMDMT